MYIPNSYKYTLMHTWRDLRVLLSQSIAPSGEAREKGSHKRLYIKSVVKIVQWHHCNIDNFNNGL
jgi:hypothetical protein